MRLALLALLFALAAPLAAAAEPSSIATRAEPETVRLGQPFVYVVEVVDDATVRYALPRDLGAGTLDVRRIDLSREAKGEQVLTRARIEVAVMDALGEVALPAIVFQVRGPQGRSTLVVPGPTVQVESTAEGEELDDIGGPQQLRLFSALPLWTAGGALAAAAALLFLWRKVRSRLRRPTSAAPVASPEERALAALDALEARGIGADGRGWYFELSGIVRGYLEEMGCLHAREMTTRELIDTLVAKEVPGLSLAQLGAWLERGDLVRFARAPATEEGARADLEKAREMVRGVAAARAPRREAA